MGLEHLMFKGLEVIQGKVRAPSDFIRKKKPNKTSNTDLTYTHFHYKDKSLGHLRLDILTPIMRRVNLLAPSLAQLLHEGSWAAFNCCSGGLSAKGERREKWNKLVLSNGIYESHCRFHSTINPKVDVGRVQTKKGPIYIGADLRQLQMTSRRFKGHSRI